MQNTISFHLVGLTLVLVCLLLMNSFLKKVSFGRLIGSGILLKVVIAIVDGIFALEINELPNFNFFIFGLAMAYTILWMFNKSYIEEE